MANAEHLQILRQGVKIWNAWREKNTVVCPDLGLAHLEGIDLRGADLEAADLRAANLREANLREADLWGANLREADLWGADLWGTNLREADLREANLRAVYLDAVNLEGANLSQAQLEKAIYSRETKFSKGFNPEREGMYLIGPQADLEGADLEGVYLVIANLEGANLEKANLREADLRGANLERANLRKADLREANLEGANLSQAQLEKAIYSRETKFSKGFNPEGEGMYLIGPQADLEGADLEGANLEGANLSKANLRKANLNEANLAEAKVLATNFTQAILTGVCIQYWKTNSETNLENVTCDYIYLKHGQEKRRPASGNFKPGEFAKYVEKVLETVDLLFKDGID